MSDGPRQVVDAVRTATRSPLGRTLAGLGLGSRAIVYGSLAVLVFEYALTRRPRNTDQGSALAALGDTSGGTVLLVVLLGGVACYVAWRWAEAIIGSVDGDRSTGRRVLAGVEGLFYVPIGYLAVVVLAGDPARAHQGEQYRGLSARVLGSGLGVVLVAVVGLVVIVVGLVWCYQGVRQTFRHQFDFPQHHPMVQPIVLTAGTIGSVARGLIVAEAGALVVYGALTHDPNETGGFDSALDTLARQPLGSVLLVVAAVGFAAFALFAVAEAIWRER